MVGGTYFIEGEESLGCYIFMYVCGAVDVVYLFGSVAKRRDFVIFLMEFYAFYAYVFEVMM